MSKTMKIAAGVLIAVVLGCVGCGVYVAVRFGGTLPELHARGTTYRYEQPNREPAVEPPPELFSLVKYPAPLGENSAYVSAHDPGASAPGIVWIAGGFDWSIGDWAWQQNDRLDDQSARAFREAGIVLMLPSLRGCNDNPGATECFFGEVEDVVAAVEYLAEQPGVDPNRVYLGGHSTGATIALLAAALGGKMKGVFALGPVEDVFQYGSVGCLTGYEGLSIEDQVARAPISFVRTLRIPTWIIAGGLGNRESARLLKEEAFHAPVNELILLSDDHFSYVAPATEAIAEAILNDQRGIQLSVRKIEARAEAGRGATKQEMEALDEFLREEEADRVESPDPDELPATPPEGAE